MDNKGTGRFTNVEHPSHYNQGGKETIDIIEEFLTYEGFKGFLKGNVLKYLHRYEYKGGVEDLDKANWYLKKLIETEIKMNTKAE